jgi:sodium-dependent phosphate cotransporter
MTAKNRKPATASSGPTVKTWAGLLLLLWVLLLGVGLVGAGFKWVSGGADGAERIFAFATNPLVGVIVGVLATSLVQSSSTVTSVIVGLVAGGMPVSLAVPMIMGANMGTTITNTIVSLGNSARGNEFERSFSAATIHDFLNLYSILIFLPVEAVFHPMERLAGKMAALFTGGATASTNNFDVIGMTTKPVIGAIRSGLEFLPGPTGGIVMIVGGIALIVLAVVRLGDLLRGAMGDSAGNILERALGRGSALAVLSGMVVTVLVQSSSTTTSLLVPLAGAGIVTLRQVYPFTMGANIGTCVTALLAATSVEGEVRVFALQIALVHLLYNAGGMAIFLGVPFLKELPLRSAAWLGARTRRNRRFAVGYVLAVFFLLPGLVLGGQMLWSGRNAAIVDITEDGGKLEAHERATEEEGLAIE